MRAIFRHPAFRYALRFLLKFSVLLLTYLVQVSVMPYISIGGITPNLIFVTVSVYVVGFGRLRGFWAGAFFGILLEVMSPTTTLLNLAFYTASSIVSGLIFSDKNQQQLEYRRSQGRSGHNMNPLLRTLLSTVMMTIAYDTVNIIKIYLSGNEVIAVHITRGLTDLAATTVLCLLLMVPIRRILGLRTPRVQRSQAVRYEGI